MKVRDYKEVVAKTLTEEELKQFPKLSLPMFAAIGAIPTLKSSSHNHKPVIKLNKISKHKLHKTKQCDDNCVYCKKEE